MGASNRSSIATKAAVDVLIIEDLGAQRLAGRQLQAVLQQEGLRAELVNLCSALDGGAIVSLAERLQPRLVVGSILFADRIPEHLALFDALRQAGVRSHFTLAGHLPSLAPNTFLASSLALDSILCGEAEASVVPLARALKDGSDTQNIPGLVTRGHSSPLRARVSSLDKLPFPSHDDGFPQLAGYGFATVKTSRGCGHACSFCLASAFYRKHTPGYRQRSISNIVEELESLYARGVRLVLLDDDQFLPGSIGSSLREEFVEILERELCRRSLKLAFTMKCRADEVEIPIFRRLQEMGLVRIYIGVESGSQTSLDILNKQTTPGQNAAALSALDSLGLVADFGTLLFHPWTSLQTIHEDLAWLNSVLPVVPTLFTFQEVQVYPGTALARKLGVTSSDCQSYCVSYTIGDPRVELLRRLNRLVFGPSSQHSHLYTRLTQAWFKHLIQHRLVPVHADARRYETLKNLAASANRAALDMWQKMLSHVERQDPEDAAGVNARAGEWACGLNVAIEPLLEQLERAERQ